MLLLSPWRLKPLRLQSTSKTCPKTTLNSRPSLKWMRSKSSKPLRRMTKIFKTCSSKKVMSNPLRKRRLSPSKSTLQILTCSSSKSKPTMLRLMSYFNLRTWPSRPIPNSSEDLEDGLEEPPDLFADGSDVLQDPSKDSPGDHGLT